MIIEFRVLAVSKETQHYDTDMIRGVFAAEHPILDTVDNLPPNAVMTVLSGTDWKPVVKPTHCNNYLCVGFAKDIE